MLFRDPKPVLQLVFALLLSLTKRCRRKAQEGISIDEKLPVEPIVRGILVGDLVDARSVKAKDLRARMAEQDGRVGGDDELRVAPRFQILQ